MSLLNVFVCAEEKTNISQSLSCYQNTNETAKTYLQSPLSTVQHTLPTSGSPPCPGSLGGAALQLEPGGSIHPIHCSPPGMQVLPKPPVCSCHLFPYLTFRLAFARVPQKVLAAAAKLTKVSKGRGVLQELPLPEAPPGEWSQEAPMEWWVRTLCWLSRGCQRWEDGALERAQAVATDAR